MPAQTAGSRMEVALDSRIIIGPEDPEKAVGFVRLVDMMPRAEFTPDITADQAIVQAARVSYGAGTKKVQEDSGLLRYLLRHQHTTPFEMVQFKFHIRMPIFIYRQWFRHRSSEQCEIEISSTDAAARKFMSMNEYSARYSVVPDIFYTPKELRGQSKTNKQGGEEPVTSELNEDLGGALKSCAIDDRHLYEELISKGVSRELARLALPVSYVTEFYMSINLWNLLHMLKLRCDSHAQLEIRHYANALAWYVRRECPVTYQAWLDYMVNAKLFSAQELELLPEDLEGGITDNLDGLSAREAQEFRDKLAYVPVDPAALAETQGVL